MRAETGVGPSIASGSQVWSGTCADLATAPPSRPSAIRTAAVLPCSTTSDLKTASNSTEPVRWMSRKIASTKVASPNAFMMNAFLPAATAVARWCQKLIRR